jgi:hypothetical protein
MFIIPTLQQDSRTDYRTALKTPIPEKCQENTGANLAEMSDRNAIKKSMFLLTPVTGHRGRFGQLCVA